MHFYIYLGVSVEYSKKKILLEKLYQILDDLTLEWVNRCQKSIAGEDGGGSE